MIKEILKLNLSLRQYSLTGGILMISCIVFCIAASRTVDYSLPTGTVLLCTGFIMGVFGCIFKSACNDFNEEDNDKAGNGRMFGMIMWLTAGIWVISAVCTGFSISRIIKKDNAKVDEIISQTAAPVVTQTQVVRVTEARSEVYVVDNGERYHYSPGCPGDDSYIISIEEALDRGLTPCKKCVKD